MLIKSTRDQATSKMISCWSNPSAIELQAKWSRVDQTHPWSSYKQNDLVPQQWCTFVLAFGTLSYIHTLQSTSIATFQFTQWP
jgi:hypothetical protein